MIIYLEGPDGSGKSTLCLSASEMLRESGYVVDDNANVLVPTHPKLDNRLNEKQLFAQLKEMANSKYVYIIDRCMISDYVYRVFDSFNTVTTFAKIIKFLKDYAHKILLIYCNNKKAEKYMLERGDESPIAIQHHSEISKVFDIVMDSIKPVMPYTFIHYDFTKRKAINETLGKISYFAYMNNGGSND